MNYQRYVVTSAQNECIECECTERVISIELCSVLNILVIIVAILFSRVKEEFIMNIYFHKCSERLMTRVEEKFEKMPCDQFLQDFEIFRSLLCAK